ncbi:filaggrin-like [Grammomys surdaster]|uniref:filaggrin-like n=1 Tax=Grammomys surdaster TaxID=491861 RepID=UPI00109FB89A|nr:filaggrin-like [Grammomys surdaster]
MATLLESVTTIIKIFVKYSNNENEDETLSKEELKELLEEELQAVLKNPHDQDTAEVFMQMLDVDHDDKLDFTEYLLMVLKLTQAYYEAFKNKKLQIHGSKKRSKHDYEGLEDDREEEKSRRRKHRRTDGKKKTERSNSPTERTGKRHGSKSRNEDSDSNRRRETEKHRHHEDSTRKQKRGCVSKERRDRGSKKHGQSRERNYEEIYENGQYSENWEETYNNCYYKSEDNKKEQREGGRRGVSYSSNSGVQQGYESEQASDSSSRSGARQGQDHIQQPLDFFLMQTDIPSTSALTNDVHSLHSLYSLPKRGKFEGLSVLTATKATKPASVKPRTITPRHKLELQLDAVPSPQALGSVLCSSETPSGTWVSKSLRTPRAQTSLKAWGLLKQR